MDIKEFKQQNPDYADVPDLQLADALHAKYYADVPRDQFMQKVGVAGPGGNFSMATDRDSYAKQFVANNPQASQGQLDAVLAQYDQKNYDFATAPAASNPAPVQSGPRMLTDRAAFDDRLNQRLNQGKAGGIVPDLPELHTTAPHTQTPHQRLLEELRHDYLEETGQHPAPLPPSNVSEQWQQDDLRKNGGVLSDIGANAVGGLLSTLGGIGATYGSIVGADQFAGDSEAIRKAGADVARLNGGDTILGKTANLAGSILPAMAGAGTGLTAELASNAGLFGVPAFRDTYREQKAAGQSDTVAIEHALAAAGINTALPTIAPAGSRAVTALLGAGEATGLKGAATSIGQAMGEGAGFNAASTAINKGIDVANGIQTSQPWIDGKGMLSDAAAFALLRGAYMAPGAVDAALDKVAPSFQVGRAMQEDAGSLSADPASAGAMARARLDHSNYDPAAITPQETARAPGDVGPSPMTRAAAPKATVTDIAAAPDVDSAIAAASAAVSSRNLTDVASQLMAIRPLEDSNRAPAAAPVDPGTAMPDGRIEPTLGLPHDAAPPDSGTVPPDIPAQDPAVEPIRAEPPPLQPLDDVGDWHAFPKESGTLGIPRADMPQIKAEHRGALVNFLNARGIAHEHAELPADQIKPTQAEFSADKVQKAFDHEGGDRSILVSNDGHVLDGHHQWLAAMEKGEPVKAIVLDAPIQKLIDTVREFPSAEQADGVAPAGQPSRKSWDAGAQEKQRRLDEQMRQAEQNAAQRKNTAGARMRERVKVSNPFLHFLANHGVNPDEKADIGLEPGRAGNRMVPGFGQVFRKSGLRLDELALMARDAGFLANHDIDSPMDTGGTRKLAEMIQKAIASKEVIGAPADVERAAPTADQRLLAEAHRLGIESDGKTADELYDAVAGAHREQEGQSDSIGAGSVIEHADVERMADQFTPAEAAVLAHPDNDIPFDLDDPRTWRNRKLTDEQIDAIKWAKGEESAAVGGRQAQVNPASDAAESAGRTAPAREGGADQLTVGERKDDPYTRDLFGGQDLFDDIKTRPGTVEAQKDAGRGAISDLAKRLGIAHIDRRSPDQGSKVSVLGSRLLADFVAGKPAQLVGEKVVTPHDLAVLAQVYRDPRFETFRVFFMRGDEVAGESGYTSRLPASVTMPRDFVDQIKSDKQRFGADGYYVLHNHPSGRAEPSGADQRVTNHLDQHVDGFLGHVVIDHNEYAVIQNWGHEVFKAPQLNGRDFTSIPEVEHGLIGVKLSDPESVARAAKALQVKDGFATLVLTDAGGRVQLLVDMPIKALQMAQGKDGRTRAKALVRRMARESGSGGHRFLILPGDSMTFSPYLHLVADGILTDIVKPGGESAQKQGAYFGGNFLDRNQKAMRVADPLEGIPKPFLKRIRVDHDVYIEDEGRWSTEKVPAHIALKSVREDIDTLEAMLNCMKG